MVTDKDEIHEHIIAYNIAHYSNAESSPLGLNTPLYHKLGPSGTTKFSDDVLNGTINIKDLEDIEMKETIELLHSAVKLGKMKEHA